MLNVMFRTLR